MTVVAHPTIEAQSLRPWLTRHQTAITRTAAVIAFFGLWELVVRSRLVNPLFICTPSAVVVRLVQVFATGVIWKHIFASGQIALYGFGLAVLIGIPIGVLMGRLRVVRDTLEPFIIAKYSAPTVAFLPLLILWLGVDVKSKVALVFLNAVFIMIINTEAGVSNVDEQLIETVRSFGAKEIDILSKVVIPAALPFIIAGFRLAIGPVLIMVVVAEYYASNVGLGYWIFQAGASYNTADIFVGVTILSAIGVTLNALFRMLERRLSPWRR